MSPAAVPTLPELVSAERTAVLVQEVQEGVVGPSSRLPALAEAAAEVGLLDHLAVVLAAARAAGVPVLHCTAADMPRRFGANGNARLFAATLRLGPLGQPEDPMVQPVASVFEDGDILVPRFHGLSPLSGSQVDSLLRNEGISTVVITGVSLNVAIPNMVFDAVNRSYQVVLVSDAVAGVPASYGAQVIEHSLRPLATLVTAAELAEIWASDGPPPSGP